METVDKINILNKIAETVEGNFKSDDEIHWEQLSINKSGVLDEYIVRFKVFEQRNNDQ